MGHHAGTLQRKEGRVGLEGAQVLDFEVEAVLLVVVWKNRPGLGRGFVANGALLAGQVEQGAVRTVEALDAEERVVGFLQHAP